jgi:ribosomal protein L21
MTQALYAHMNNKKIKIEKKRIRTPKKKKNSHCCWLTLLLPAVIAT